MNFYILDWAKKASTALGNLWRLFLHRNEPVGNQRISDGDGKLRFRTTKCVIRHPCKAKWMPRSTMASARNERTASTNEARPASPSGLTCVPGSQPRAPPAAGTLTPVVACATTCVRVAHWKHQAGQKAPTTGALSRRPRMTRGTASDLAAPTTRALSCQQRMTMTARNPRSTCTCLVWPTWTRLICNVIPALKGTSPNKSAR